MNLQQVKKQTTWNDAANVINTNTQTIAQKIAAMEAGRGTIKGYFASLDALQSAYPVASIGDTAYVGASYPYAVYKYTESGWVDTGATGGESSNAYTKEESNELFLPKSGGEITGDLEIGVVTISQDSYGYVTIDSDRNDPDAQLDIYAGGGIHLRSTTTVHGSLSASHITENGKSLSDKYATKEEAYDYVNVGDANGLSDAINKTPSLYRMAGQVLTFKDISLESTAMYSLWVTSFGSDVSLVVKIGDIQSVTNFTTTSTSLTSINEELYNFIINDANLKPFIKSSAITASLNVFTITMTQAVENEPITITKVSGSGGFTYDRTILARYAIAEVVSYQYMALSTADASYTDLENWKKNEADQRVYWKDFFNL